MNESGGDGIRTGRHSLRQRAEEILRLSPAEIAEISPRNIQELVHELQIHQIELQMQNEELRRQQADLEQARTQFAELYDFAPVGYLTLDRHSIVHNANLTAAALLGLEPAALRDARMTRFVHRDDQDIFHLHRTAVFDHDTVQTCELRMKTTDDTPIWVRLESIAFEELSSCTRQCRTVLIDTSALRQTQELALRNSHLASVGILAAGVMSQLNNPLNMIKLSAQLLGRTTDAQRRDMLLQQMTSGVDKASAIIKSMERFSRHGGSEKLPDSPARILERAIEGVRELANEKAVAINAQLDNGLPDLLLSATDIELAFGHLLANAIEASGPGQAIRVSAAITGDDVQVRISDEGKGIAAGEIGHIFDPFYSRRSDRVAAGLGLSVVHGIVTAHSGHIEVSSVPNAGTTFSVSLPLKSAA